MTFNICHHNRIYHHRYRFFRKRKSIKALDNWVLVAGIISPLCSIPQILKIIEMRSAEEISTVS